MVTPPEANISKAHFKSTSRNVPRCHAERLGAWYKATPMVDTTSLPGLNGETMQRDTPVPARHVSGWRFFLISLHKMKSQSGSKSNCWERKRNLLAACPWRRKVRQKKQKLNLASTKHFNLASKCIHDMKYTTQSETSIPQRLVFEIRALCWPWYEASKQWFLTGISFSHGVPIFRFQPSGYHQRNHGSIGKSFWAIITQFSKNTSRNITNPEFEITIFGYLWYGAELSWMLDKTWHTSLPEMGPRSGEKTRSENKLRAQALPVTGHTSQQAWCRVERFVMPLVKGWTQLEYPHDSKGISSRSRRKLIHTAWVPWGYTVYLCCKSGRDVQQSWRFVEIWLVSFPCQVPIF